MTTPAATRKHGLVHWLAARIEKLPRAEMREEDTALGLEAPIPPVHHELISECRSAHPDVEDAVLADAYFTAALEGRRLTLEPVNPSFPRGTRVQIRTLQNADTLALYRNVPGTIAYLKRGLHIVYLDRKQAADIGVDSVPIPSFVLKARLKKLGK